MYSAGHANLGNLNAAPLPEGSLIWRQSSATSPRIFGQIHRSYKTMQHPLCTVAVCVANRARWRPMGTRSRPAEIQTLASKVVYKNRWMTVREDSTQRGDGTPGIYGVVEKRDFAVTAAIENGHIHLVEQYRYPVKARYWEMPQGSWETTDIDPATLAAEELREETGLTARKLTHVGHLFLAAAYSTQGYNVYLATGLEQGEPDRESEEHGLISRSFTLAEFETMIRDGAIKDATTLAAFALLQVKRLL